MNKVQAVSVATLISGLAALGAANVSAAEMEKCYGVAKHGKNDCATKTSSCAGTSTKDGQSDAFIAVPAGLCEKLAGGNLESM